MGVYPGLKSFNSTLASKRGVGVYPGRAYCRGLTVHVAGQLLQCVLLIEDQLDEGEALVAVVRELRDSLQQYVDSSSYMLLGVELGDLRLL